MLNLTDTLHSSDARVERSIIFIDLVDSTGLKLNTPEASWLPHYGWFYEVCADRVAAGGAGTIVKLLGDGVMIAYSEDQATQAINDAITIQEALEDGVEGQHVRVSPARSGSRPAKWSSSCGPAKVRTTSARSSTGRHG